MGAAAARWRVRCAWDRPAPPLYVARIRTATPRQKRAAHECASDAKSAIARGGCKYSLVLVRARRPPASTASPPSSPPYTAPYAPLSEYP